MNIRREFRINEKTFYDWKKKYSGMCGEHLRQLKQLQEENVRLKQLFANVSLDNKLLKEFLSKNGRHWGSPHSRYLFGTEPSTVYYHDLLNFWVL